MTRRSDPTGQPEPATALMSVNDWGGTGLTTLIIRSAAWILVRAFIGVLATTTLVPMGLFEKRRGRLATPAAVAKARTASTVPTMM